MKVLIATGGTGGHIYPATALADQLRKQQPDAEILFIGNSDRMEKDIIPQQGYEFRGITAARFNDENVNKLQALKVLYSSYKTCLKIVENFKPDIIVGFGGYVTVPVIMAGKKLHIPVVIHEQNSIAGLANRVLGHFVDKIITVYQSANEEFPPAKTVCLGNPREGAIRDFHPDRSILTTFGLDPSKRTVLIVMGSLGSYSVNDRMTEILNALKNRSYNVIYVTGKSSYDTVREQIEDADNLKIVPYIDQFNVAGNCDLVVSRGGATSACEYMVLGLPSIIVPSPYVPNNHQFLNAKAMMDNGASIILEEKDLTSENLIPLIEEIINDEARLLAMSEAARKMSHPDAADRIIDVINEMAGKKK
ncbi:MAG: undecaprenyldiphospho-muramoylpentapeptide beta-N-acetylglucosaminyltransferase [Erysipelotrichaceae bacterium]|nr:undecaprenyldiphospho-muramoylpentapeptide beta-N-acetylglucosaminyltransferase [Erysipelotrichaceae bacterium]